MSERSNSIRTLAQHFHWTTRRTAAVFGLILLRWPFPVPVDFQDPILAVDWPSLEDYVVRTPLNLISELMNWVRSRPDFVVPEALVWTQQEVKVGDWTYRYFVLTPSPLPRSEEE